MSHPYAGLRIALLTKHEKERVLSPLVCEALGAELACDSGFDTDRLGTFTRDVPRLGSQLEAARRKAELAIARSGAPLGMGSEGAFLPGPFGLGAFDLEIVVLVDPDRRLEVVGRSYGPAVHVHGHVTCRDSLLRLASDARFPEHGLTLRPNDEADPRIRKGLRSIATLDAAFEEALAESREGVVFVENDLRAHQHPTRRQAIARAGRDLVARVACLCPACGVPGYGLRSRVPGLPCGDCGAPTEDALEDELGCVSCSHVERRPRLDRRTADPHRCNECNP